MTPAGWLEFDLTPDCPRERQKRLPLSTHSGRWRPAAFREASSQEPCHQEQELPDGLLRMSSTRCLVGTGCACPV